jgi:predicted nucleic acid-binding protein
VVEVDRVSIARLAAEHLDPGETAAIALSVQERTERLLVDDRQARDVAGRLGIP